jgi:hypothetical protein
MKRYQVPFQKATKYNSIDMEEPKNDTALDEFIADLKNDIETRDLSLLTVFTYQTSNIIMRSSDYVTVYI